MTLPVTAISKFPSPRRAPTTVTGMAAIGTSIIQAGGLYTLLDAGIGAPLHDFSHPLSPVDVAGDDVNCMRAQVTTALNTSGVNAAFLDCDNGAASMISQSATAQDAATQLGAQLDRLIQAGFFLICLWRGVGNWFGLDFGSALRAPMGAIFGARPSINVIDVLALFGGSYSLSSTVPTTGGLTVGQMFSDELPTADHYTSTGAGLISRAALSVYSRMTI